jgi:hypothetical protein
MRRPAKSPHPVRGTPAGDDFIGQCADPACKKDIHRADSFVCLLSGDVLHVGCHLDWEKPKEGMLL